MLTQSWISEHIAWFNFYEKKLENVKENEMITIDLLNFLFTLLTSLLLVWNWQEKSHLSIRMWVAPAEVRKLWLIVIIINLILIFST